ncbi:uncharacterized protein TNCV_1889481 [Trichonephila clavipes]|nr:uncharacterized protein TNCV_1889481 [Trichonephila clavipes]
MPDDHILDASWHGLTLKEMKRENLVSEVFGNEQSESDIRYKKLLQLCLIMPDDCLLRGLSQELYSKVLKREKYFSNHFWGGEREFEIGY